jgi:hypothetical protein
MIRTGFPARFFHCKKKKPGSFLSRKIFAGPDDPEILQKPGTTEKFTPEPGRVNTVRTRIPGNYPVSGYVLDNLFSREKLFCRIFSG